MTNTSTSDGYTQQLKAETQKAKQRISKNKQIQNKIKKLEIRRLKEARFSVRISNLEEKGKKQNMMTYIKNTKN